MPVIVSTNLSVDDIMDIDEAIGSRLVEMCGDSLVEVMGKRLNYRIYII